MISLQSIAVLFYAFFTCIAYTCLLERLSKRSNYQAHFVALTRSFSTSCSYSSSAYFTGASDLSPLLPLLLNIYLFLAFFLLGLGINTWFVKFSSILQGSPFSCQACICVRADSTPMSERMKTLLRQLFRIRNGFNEENVFSWSVNSKSFFFFLLW